MTCYYEAEFKRYRWCGKEAQSSCRIQVETTETMQMVKEDHVTLKDIQRMHKFTVTMEKLLLDESDTYWCGIKKKKLS